MLEPNEMHRRTDHLTGFEDADDMPGQHTEIIQRGGKLIHFSRHNKLVDWFLREGSSCERSGASTDGGGEEERASSDKDRHGDGDVAIGRRPSSCQEGSTTGSAGCSKDKTGPEMAFWRAFDHPPPGG